MMQIMEFEFLLMFSSWFFCFSIDKRVTGWNSTDVKLQFGRSMTVGCAEDVLKLSCDCSVMRQHLWLAPCFCGTGWRWMAYISQTSLILWWRGGKCLYSSRTLTRQCLSRHGYVIKERLDARLEGKVIIHLNAHNKVPRSKPEVVACDWLPKYGILSRSLQGLLPAHIFLISHAWTRG